MKNSLHVSPPYLVEVPVAEVGSVVAGGVQGEHVVPGQVLHLLGQGGAGAEGEALMGQRGTGGEDK